MSVRQHEDFLFVDDVIDPVRKFPDLHAVDILVPLDDRIGPGVLGDDALDGVNLGEELFVKALPLPLVKKTGLNEVFFSVFVNP
nr:hypothetical protein [Chondromyces crocatus]